MVIAQLNKATLKYMHSAEIKAVLDESGSECVGTDPAVLARFVDDEAARWKKVASQLNITFD